MWQNVIFVIASLLCFLAALRVMRAGLEGMASGRLPIIIHRFVKTPTRGIITGTTVTALVQSSAAVTAIAVGMVAGETMVFRDALGLILGSNVGSTITPQLLTLNLWSFVIPCGFIGLIFIVSGRKGLLNPGMALSGFSAIFIALQCMKTALYPLTLTEWFRHTLSVAGGNPLLAVLAGTLASAAVQSSTATTVITMALATANVIPLHGAIGIVLGANIGTCLTSILAAIGQSRPAQQVALSHVVLNVGGVLLTLPFIAPFTEWMRTLASNPSQQIANAHTIFNVICTLLVWPATSQFAALVERLLPNNRNT